ncbi:MAG: DNA polymerase III subunit delta [Firmicutes bacterium]|nr:DNA polymerase III subunit delta [Bacillota bacterium]
MAVKEDNFIKLKQQIKSGDIKNLYLFFGEETFLKDMYLKRMGKTVPEDGFSDFNRILLEGNDVTSDSVDDAVDSFPMMSEKKLLVIKDSGIFKSPNEETKVFWQKRLADIPDYLLMIFDEKSVDKRSVTYKALAKYGMPVEFKYIKEYELVAWVVREATKSGKKISKENAEYLVGICDSGLQNLKNELDKLINYCNGEIYKSDIDKVVSRHMGIVIFELTDAIMAKDNDRAMKILLDLKEKKESPFNILYLLSSAFDKMLQCCLILSEGGRYDEIAAKLKLPPFVARKYIDSSKGFSQDFLIDRICRTADYDLAIKQGEIDEWTALLQYVFDGVKR